MAHSAPQVVILEYPITARVRCPRCWCSGDSGVTVRGEYCDAAHLAKHQKAKHPGDTITYKCSLCTYKGTGRYPLKTVKNHFELKHGVPQRGSNDNNNNSNNNNNNNNDTTSSANGVSGNSGVTDEPGPSARDASSPRGEFAPLQAAGVWSRSSGSAPRASTSGGGLERSRTSDPRQPRLSFAATPITTTTPPPPSTTTSPTYAAVTAAGPSAPTTSSVPAVSRKPRVTAVTSVVPRIILRRLPAEATAAMTRRGASTAATGAPRQVPAGTGAAKRTHAPAPRPSNPPALAPLRTSQNTSGGGGTQRRLTDRAPPAIAGPSTGPSTRSRRSASVPVEIAARPARIPARPSPPTTVKRPRGPTERRSPGITPPHTTEAGPSTRTRSRVTSVPVEKSALDARRAALARPPAARAASRGYPGRQQRSVEKSPGTPPVTTTTAGSATPAGTTPRGVQRSAGPRGVSLTPPPRAPSVTPPNRDLALPRLVRGSPARSPLATPPATPVVSVAATLTTSTVTVSTCGSPVMSTGLSSWRRSPYRLSPLPTIREASPCVAAVRRPILQSPPAISPPVPTSLGGGQEERRRQEEGTTLISSSEEEGDMGGPWRRHLGRRARRRRLSDSPPGDATPARAAPGPSRGPSPVTPANNFSLPPVQGNLDFSSAQGALPSAPAGAASPSGVSPGGREGGCVGSRAGYGGVRHPSDRVNVRGVMGRRRETPASVCTSAFLDEAPANLASRVEGGGEHHRVQRPVEAPRGQPSRGQPAPPAAAARQHRRGRVAARDALVLRAEAVTSIADLEDFAISVAEFFGEDAARMVRGGGPGAPVRPGRSREATGGDGARVNVPSRGGATRRGPAPAGPGQSGEGRGNWVREATRIQALYRQNRRKAVRDVLQGPAESCQVPIRQVQEYFERLYCGEGSLGNASAFVEQPDPPSQEDAEHLMDPFTEREVDRRLRRMANSAPGPDGVTYRDLRGADPGARLLTAAFNACRRLGAVPAAWKNSNTILVYKKGERDMLENWRPLALGDTTPKLFAAVVADRLTDWAITRGKLSPAQKGFLRDEGCLEHNFVLQEILTDARRTRRQAVVAWLDLSNAFGSVPHATIRRALVRAGVPRGLIEIWGSMYDGCTTRVRTAEGPTAPIIIRSGVRQGCPLSPIIFDLAIDSVLRAATDVGAGYEILGAQWSSLAYADDIALIASAPEGMQRLLVAVEEEARSIGLRFNPAKCATLHIGAGNGGRVLPTSFVIQGQPVHHLANGEPYSHLGVPTGFSVIQTPYAAIGGLAEDLRAVDRSLLAPWQKIETVASFILPRLDFLFRGARVEKRPLKAVDLNIRRTTKSWLNLPQRASAEVVYLPPKWGGCGLLPLSDLADVMSVAHVFRMLTADDAAVRSLAWESLRGVVRRRLGHTPSCEDIASFLSGSLEGRLRGGGEASLWSRARNAARRQSERLLLRWRWVEETRELVLECRGPGGTVKIPPGARSQVVNRLRNSLAEFYAGTLRCKRDQGKVFEVSSRCGVSNHFVRGGSFTRFADWRFVHRARLDVLPLNGARRWGESDVRCRRCGGAAETLPHVLCHCGVHAAAIQLRHDAVLHRLWKACRLPGDVRVNRRVEGINGELGGLRPDLVVRHEPSKSVVICDVTVPFENRLEAFEEARARKVAKYSPIAEALRREGYRVVVTAFVVGALGSWDPRNEAVLSLLRVGGAYAAMMRRLVVSDTIRWSRDIYVEHVSGVRQYLAPPAPRGDGPLLTPPRAVRRRWLAPERTN